MFNADRYADVLRLYEAEDFGSMVYISRNSVAKMMLKILVTNDYSWAYSQLHTFSSQSYNFEPSTEIREHDADECMNIYMLVEYYSGLLQHLQFPPSEHNYCRVQLPFAVGAFGVETVVGYVFLHLNDGGFAFALDF